MVRIVCFLDEGDGASMSARMKVRLRRVMRGCYSLPGHLRVGDSAGTHCKNWQNHYLI